MAAPFLSLGLSDWLVTACRTVGITAPTEIQRACIPAILEGRDVIGSAPTGSGKTAAFALPILHVLAKDPYGVFALVLSPTRELAFQIAEQFRALGRSLNLRDAVVVGGVDMMQQGLALAKKPHVVVATPGRLADHIASNPDNVSLRKLRFLVLDEADRLLDPTFARDLDVVLAQLPPTRQTLLFSATMSRNLEKLQRMAMRDPFVHHVAQKFDTVERLRQQYVFIPEKAKDSYLVHLLRRVLADKTVIVFTTRYKTCERIKLMFKELRLRCVALHSCMPQAERLASLGKFKSAIVKILVSTDVGSRGLDIPAVECVLNYDVPQAPKDYVHRVGRTARAGRGGVAVTIVCERDIELIQHIEEKTQKQMEELELDDAEVLKNINEVTAARHAAMLYMLETEFGKSKEINEQKRQMLEALEAAGDGGDDSGGEAEEEQKEGDEGKPETSGKGAQQHHTKRDEDKLKGKKRVQEDGVAEGGERQGQKKAKHGQQPHAAQQQQQRKPKGKQNA